MKNYKRHLILVFFVMSFFTGTSITKTLVSQFTWENGATIAAIGPNATSISSSAFTSNDGNNATFGLNAGLPKRNIDMILPGYLFDYEGIEVSVDFQRDESQGEFVSRGQDFIFGINNGNLYIRYRVEDDLGGYTTEIGNNIYNIPDDNLFRNLNFYYLPDSGIARVLVDNVVVWENNTLTNKSMYWSAANEITVGKNMDGTGRNRAIFDNLQIFGISSNPKPLPIELLSFSGNVVDNQVLLKWVTQTELNNDYFTIERSIDAITFEPVENIKGAGTSSIKSEYSLFDEKPYSGVSYYRLKQTDYDGTFSYSTLIAVTLVENKSNEKFSIYPNPVSNNQELNIKGLNENQRYNIEFINCTGEIVNQQVIDTNDFGEIQLAIDKYEKGIYLIKLTTTDKGTTQKTSSILVSN